MSDPRTSVCPCDLVAHPAAYVNRPAEPRLRRRVGTFSTFRDALIRSIGTQPALETWTARERQDLGVMLLEMWAYLADVLTFYDEEIANAAYLTTAEFPDAVRRLVGLLGHRPRPGIGARATLVAQADTGARLTVPAGLAVQSKPGPGERPQVFETTADEVVDAEWNAWLIEPERAAAPVPTSASVLVQATEIGLRRDDRALVYDSADAAASLSRYRFLQVAEVTAERDALGREAVRVRFTSALSSALGATAFEHLRLQVGRRTAQLWTYASPISGSVVKLDGFHPDVRPGTLVLLVYQTTTEAARLFRVTGAQPRFGTVSTSLQSPYTEVTLGSDVSSAFGGTPDATKVTVHYAWQNVGRLVGDVATNLPAAETELALIATPRVLPEGAFAVLMEGADHQAFNTTASFDTSLLPPHLVLGGDPARSSAFAHPITVSANLLPATRGQTVRDEVLGSGDATIPSQEFELRQSPLTYLANPTAPGGYETTLEVYVDGIRWQEVRSFLAAKARDQVYTTFEDAGQVTHVVFGDGVLGSRLPTGRDNVWANYRYGTGAAAPGANALATILKPISGLRAVRNPAPAAGGEDPEAPEDIKRSGPASVLAFDRAISLRDYEVMAAQAAGIRRASARWAWAGDRQVAGVLITVLADGQQSERDLTALLRAKGDENRPVTIRSATALQRDLGITVAVNPAHLPAVVVRAVEDAIGDPGSGFFSEARTPLGRPLFRDELVAAIMAVPGVADVVGLRVGTPNSMHDFPLPALLLGEAEYFSLQDLTVAVGTRI